MDTDIRVPVTKDQKSMIERAARMSERGELATWARTVLLQAAEAAVESRKQKRKAGESNPSARADPSSGV